MIRALLFVIIVAALAVIVLSLLRRTPRMPSDRDSGGSLAAALPPPVARHGLSFATARRLLHEVAFGTALAEHVPAEHVKVVSAVAAALQSAATDPRYAPRRPMLLPQLLRAVNDSDTTRRELAQMIARDPALVGSLLKLANSPLYRRGSQPVEGLERALAVLGMQGARSLVAAALVQPVFQTTSADASRFPEIVWEHTYRAAAAAEAHAAAVEGSDLFAAQLVALVMGLATLVVYRVAVDQYAARGLAPDATALATLLDEQTARVAHRIASSWELSTRVLEALEQQDTEQQAEPESALGRSLRFGRLAGALSVLRTNDRIDDDTGLASLAAAGGPGRFERLWERLSWPERHGDREAAQS